MSPNAPGSSSETPKRVDSPDVASAERLEYFEKVHSLIGRSYVGLALGSCNASFEIRPRECWNVLTLAARSLQVEQEFQKRKWIRVLDSEQ